MLLSEILFRPLPTPESLQILRILVIATPGKEQIASMSQRKSFANHVGDGRDEVREHD